MNFVEMIKAAHEKELVKDAAIAARKSKETEAEIRSMLIDLFGTDQGFEIYEHLIYSDDGLAFKAVWEYGPHGRMEFRLRGQCPKCGATCWSDSQCGQNALAEFGKLLADFRPIYTHRCASDVETITIEESLIDALKTLISAAVEDEL